VNAGKVVEGIGLCVAGVVFYGVARWQVGNDKYMRRMAESRWWWDRRTVGRLRRGEVSKEEHFDSLIRGQRFLVRWVFTPFIAIFIALALTLAVRGLASP